MLGTARRRTGLRCLYLASPGRHAADVLIHELLLTDLKYTWSVASAYEKLAYRKVPNGLDVRFLHR